MIHKWQQEAQVSEYIIHSVEPKLTIVVPVFNQEKNIIKILQCITSNTANAHDLIIIDDASNDLTVARVLEYCETLGSQSPLLGKITFVKNIVPIYETGCDNQGFLRARTEYIIECQADLWVDDYAYDKKMIHAMESLNLCAVSGRHVHSYTYLDSILSWVKYPLDMLLQKVSPDKFGVGRLNDKIFESNFQPEQNVCFVGETVARGPWLLKKSMIESVGYLDEENFFLGNDDHDLHRRLFDMFGQYVGYVPLRVYSHRQDGSTRRKREGINKQIYEHLKKQKPGSLEFKKFIKQYRPYKFVEKVSFKDG